MTVPPGRAAAWARLLAWDAPFLPVVRVETVGTAVEVRTAAGAGVDLRKTLRWSLADRAGLALQLVCIAAFLHERGWYPSRRLLRGVRVDRGRDGVAVRLASLPEATIEEGPSHRLMSASADGDELLGRLVRPLVASLVPELGQVLAEAAARRPKWEAAAALVGALLDSSARSRALRHPSGAGRTLWARRWLLPRVGAGWVASDADARRLAAAASLAAAGESRALALLTAEVEEDELLQHLSRSAATGVDGVVVTTLSSPSAPPVLLDGDERALWLLGPDVAATARWAVAAVREAGDHPSRAGEVLAAGASRAFTGPPRVPSGDRSAERLSTPAARRCLETLRTAPAGLTAEELGSIVSPAASEALGELHRTGLVRQRAAVWVAVEGVRGEPGAVAELAARLAVDSPRRFLAEALAGGDAGRLVEWCDGRLDARRPTEVLHVAEPAAGVAAVASRCAEAALQRGLAREAGDFLDGVARRHRDAHWRAVSAWRRDVIGALPEAAELARLELEGLPGRLICRVELLRSRTARLRGDKVAERAALERAVTAADGLVPEAEVLLAAMDGRDALRALRRSRPGRWTGDGLAALLHEMAYRRYDDGAWAAAATGFRAALRAATGANLDLLARIHVDLGGTAILREQPAVADRHLLLAERIFERCGSRRSLTLTRKNRAALACDRLDWESASRLLDEAGAGDGADDVLPAWLDELERVHIGLARGDVDGVRRRLPVVEQRLQPFMDRTMYSCAVAGVRAHLALAEGDLDAARVHSEGAEDGDRELFAAVIGAAAGAAPPPRLSNRWGMATTARMLAAWRNDGSDAAAAVLARDAVRFPRESAVALARCAAILTGTRERLGDGWSDRCAEAVQVLRDAGLDGWAERLAGATTGGVVEVVRALDRMLNAGTDALNPDRLASVARVVGLSGLQVWRGGELLAVWGDTDGRADEVEVAGVRVRGVGVGGLAAHAVCRLLARSLSTHPARGVEAPTVGTSLIGRSPALEKVRRLISRWAPLPAPVLVVGEPGTGKELVARELHRLSGRRGLLVPVNCAGIPTMLMEGELFGVVRGAYTGADRDRIGLVEAAEGGTLLLDEIGEMPLEVQAKVLRLLQEHEVRRVGATRARTVDVRFVAATNQDLAAARATGRFRSDLFYRLDVAVIEVPPLRDRLEDIEDLAPLFTGRCAVEYARPGVSLAPETIPLLQGYHWPGNVRELEQAVRRAVAAAAPGEALGPDRFTALVDGRRESDPVGSWTAAQEELRRSYFTRLLEECHGNRSEAARRAGISRQSLLYHLRALGIGAANEG